MKKLIQVGVLGLLLVPSFVFASWWNPFTWVRRKPSVSVVDPVVVQPIAPIPPVSVMQSPPKIEKTVVKPKPTPPPIIIETAPVASVVIVSPTPPVVVFDACRNIDGIQSVAPEHMYADEGTCISIPNNSSGPVAQVVQQNTNVTTVNNSAQINQLQSQYDQLLLQNQMLDLQGSQYAEYSMYTSSTYDQLMNLAKAPDLAGRGNSTYQMVNIILQIQANRAKINSLYQQIQSLR